MSDEQIRAFAALVNNGLLSPAEAAKRMKLIEESRVARQMKQIEDSRVAARALTQLSEELGLYDGEDQS